MLLIHSNEKYVNIDKFNCLKSKLSGDALQAISGYQLSNENYPVVVDVLKRRFGNNQLIVDAHYHNLSHLTPASNQANSLRQCYDAIEQNLRSLEALGEDVNHRHFVALISEKLPQRVLYQLYMLKEEEEDWTVTKLRQLLGKHISALEMAAGTDFSQVSVHTEVNKQTSHMEGHKRPPQMRPTASEDLLLVDYLQGKIDLQLPKGNHRLNVFTVASHTGLMNVATLPHCRPEGKN